MAARRSSAVAAAAQKPTQAPTLSRRHAAGAPSARGLLFTLLGEFVLTGDGLAWTSAVLAASGRLDAEKVGRRTRWRLSASARRMLTEGADRIYSFTGPSDRWDGRWLLV